MKLNGANGAHVAAVQSVTRALLENTAALGIEVYPREAADAAVGALTSLLALAVPPQ